MLSRAWGIFGVLFFIMSELSFNNLIEVFKLGKITPYRVLDVPNKRIYEFWRFDSDERVSFYDKEVKREKALIVVDLKKKTFNIKYSSVTCGLQNVENLGLDKLPEVCQSLKEAGFK